MPTDGSGVYSLPAGYLATTGESILASQHNSPLEDIAAALTARLPRNGAAPMTGDLDMDGNDIVDAGTIGATVVNEAIGSDIASAATTDIGAAAGKYVSVTGTTTITSLGSTAAGVEREVKFTGALTLTHGASLILPGAANITTAAGDVARFRSEGSGVWRCTKYTRASGQPVSALGTTPVGSVLDFAGTSAPTGWLFCYGQAISRTTYAALFAAISTTYGVGDGSTTFNVPDARGRVIAGQDDMGGTSANRLTGLTGGVDGDVLGAAGGAETHTLTIAEMPAHTHPQDPTTVLAASGQSDRSSGTSGRGGTTGSTGGGGAHNNVQPTLVLNKIIYAGV